MHQNFLIYLLCAVGITALSSCNESPDNYEDKVIARVYNSYLYYDEVAQNMPAFKTHDDSAVWINNYIDNWIKKQILLRKAELNLNEKQKDITKKLEDYRATLLIHRFEEYLINNNMDTVVTQEDIETYYEEFKTEFRLKHDYVKTIYVKIPKSAPDFIKIRKWYKSDKEEDLNDLEDYCFQNGLDFNFDVKWEKFNDILNRTGYTVRSNNKRFLENNHYIETRDSIYRYYVNIKDYRLVNDIAPLSIVQKDIKKIILNKRRIELLEEMENSVYQEVQNKNVIEKLY